ncbi:MAG: hypothetical protein ACYCVL_09415 [Gemmatimonadaceae bacterium]
MLTSSNTVADVVEPAVHTGDETNGPFPYRWDEVVAPASALGAFEYQVELGIGDRWIKIDGFGLEKAPIRSGERRSVLILDLKHTHGVRLVTSGWRVRPDELRHVRRSQLTPYLSSSIPAVREAVFEALPHLRR